MSAGIRYLHSHSALERDLKFPKNTVLIDTEYGDMFGDESKKPFTYKRRDYYKVNTLNFWRKHGVFKNLSE